MAFGSVMATLMFFLHYFKYRYHLGSLSTEFYTSAVAILFTGIGVWIGYESLSGKKASNKIEAISEQEAKNRYHLNEREYQVLILIAEGRTNKEIANTLFLAVPTIKTHVSNLYSKLDVRNRTEAIHKARNLGILS